MANLDKYLEMRSKAGALIFGGKEQEGDALLKEAVKFREDNFTKADWTALLNMSKNVQEKIWLKNKIESLSEDK